MYYAFLMVLKHPELKDFVEVVLDGKTRFSGALLLPDGTPYEASSLNQQSTSSVGSEGTETSSGSGGVRWKRQVGEVC